MVATIGVLALQGDFARHQEMLHSLGCHVRQVRYRHDFDGLAGLIIPGGESTTISKQIERNGLRDEILVLAEKRPVMGTCAGMILMAQEAADDRVRGLDMLDVSVARNSWGRQVHSFAAPLEMHVNGQLEMYPGVFIRAPRIQEVGPDVEVLAEIEGEPVLVRQGIHLGATFHPELTDNTRIHKLFLEAQ